MIKLENNNLLIETKNDGAELTRIYSKTTDKEFLWNADSKYWARHSPILFPIVGRLKDNETIINDTLYNMNQHGFARDMFFDLINDNENSLTYKLESNDITKTHYPYDFELIIKYVLRDSSINVKWQVKNKSSEDMYFSIGAHPAFNVPFDSDINLNNYYLKLQSNNNVNSYSLDGPFVSTKSKVDSLSNITLTPELFINDAIIYDNINKISICSKNSNTSINVKFENFPFVGIWSPYYKDTNSIAPFVCIEPWYGIADSIDSNKDYKAKLGINKLSVGEIFEASYEIEICI
jgi:galactose mutarotase-like enzyme